MDDIFNFGGAPARPAASTEVIKPKSAADDLLDVFSTNAPAQVPASGEANAQPASDPLNDIFAAGSQPLAPKVQEIPTNDKLSQLNAFYSQAPAGGQPGAGAQAQPNAF